MEVFSDITEDLINKEIEKDGVLQNWDITITDEEMEKLAYEFI